MCVCVSVFVWSKDERSAQRHHSNCLHNLCNCISHKVERQICNVEFGTHTVWLMGGSSVRIRNDTAGDYFIILIWPSLQAVLSHPTFGMARHTYTHTRTHRDEHHTSESMRTGLMPKKGLIAIPGTVSASGSAYTEETQQIKTLVQFHVFGIVNK